MKKIGGQWQPAVTIPRRPVEVLTRKGAIRRTNGVHWVRGPAELHAGMAQVTTIVGRNQFSTCLVTHWREILS